MEEDHPEQDNPDDSESEFGDAEENSFISLFQSFSKQWLHAQLTHHVSLAASNEFWNLSFQYVSKMVEMKEKEKVRRKIPQFLQARKNIYTEISPRIFMTFAFLNKEDGTITCVDVEKTPLDKFQRNPQYQKLYEEAHIEVIYYNNF